jgi:hypothetical protein
MILRVLTTSEKSSLSDPNTSTTAFIAFLLVDISFCFICSVFSATETTSSRSICAREERFYEEKNYVCVCVCITYI